MAERGKMSDLLTAIDRRGLIRESYRIEGIQAEECRSIFLDWALFDEHEMPQADRIRLLISAYAEDKPDHPMTTVLKSALAPALTTARRRGGRAGRARES